MLCNVGFVFFLAKHMCCTSCVKKVEGLLDVCLVYIFDWCHCLGSLSLLLLYSLLCLLTLTFIKLNCFTPLENNASHFFKFCFTLDVYDFVYQ